MANPPKGEFVLVIEGECPPEADVTSDEDALKLVEEYRGQGLSLKDAAKKAAEKTGLSKNALYDLAVGHK